MTQQKPSTPDIRIENNDQKKKRRSKGDECQRKFVCKICQKAYLSYPALYTHTKSKHEKTPGKINQADIAKRGKPIDTAIFINELVKLLKQQSSGIVQQYTLQQVLQPFEQKQQLASSISFWINNSQQKYIDESKCQKNSIDQVIVKILNTLVNRVDLHHLQQLCIILLIWRDAINKQWKSYEITGDYKVFSQQADTQFLLRAVNDLVLTFFPNKSQIYLNKINKVRILKGPGKDVNLCNILMTISKWLYGQKYTKQKLKYNECD